MTDRSENEALLGFLESGDAHGLGANETVTHIETHASHVFLAGARAYKMKKPVKFTFLDFSTLEKRKAACEHEVELNRRTAPDIYLGVTPVRRRGGDFVIGGDEGEAVEYLVEMKRFGGEGLLATLAEKGALDLSAVTELAVNVAAFHGKAEVTPDFGGAAGTASIVAGSAEDMKPVAGTVLDAEKVRRVTALSEALIERHAALLDERRKAGYVRHCHGDLHLGNVTMVEGHPVIFDCIEFDDRLARIDVLYDLAFLLMDLAFRAGRDARLAGFAARALNTWLDSLREEDIGPAIRGLALLPLFVSMRAVVRAKVTAVQVNGEGDEKKRDNEKREKARAYLDFALKALEETQPLLVAIGGLSGTGKSTVAKEIVTRIGGPLGAVHLRSDIIRKRMFGAGPLDRLPDGAYAPGVGNRVYEEMHTLARKALEAGRSVVTDAVFAREEERLAVAELTSGTDARFRGLWLEAPAEVLEERVAAREREGRDPSDAGIEVLRKQLAYDPGKMTWARVDASGTPGEVLEEALDSVDMTAD
ncbi:AAA family ATPase [Parvibaculum sp.]|uniref:bifunctional aminoglycoside phosphotransferase/ATP-binding protein n=1 Tax=Parvibaculum sp. TaxID=2024848 RepID=UPI0032970E88